MAYADYMSDLKQVIAKHNIAMPGNLLEDWKDIYESYNNGLDDFWEELNEKPVRNDIEKLLGEAVLQDHPEFRFFKDEVARYDALIQQLLISPASGSNANWWDNMLPKKATADFIEQVRSYHGIEIASRIEQID